MGKVPQSRYTMGLSIPATYLVYLVFRCQVVVKPRGQGLRMRTSI